MYELLINIGRKPCQILLSTVLFWGVMGASGAEAQELVLDVYDHWNEGSAEEGYCATVAVSNTSTEALIWQVDIELNDAILREGWGGTGTFIGMGSLLSVTSQMGAAPLAAGQIAVFGYCAEVSGPNWEPELLLEADPEPNFCDAFGDDNDLAHAIPLSGTIDGQICEDDHDYYLVRGGGEILVSFEHAEGDIDILAFSLGNEQITGSFGEMDSESINLPDTYVVRVYADFGDENSYSIERVGVPAGACASLCKDPMPISWPETYQSGPIGTGAVCLEVMQPVVNGNCGNFADGRQLFVNGMPMSCDGGNWGNIPKEMAGGYCITATPGQFDWAFITLW